MIKKLLVCLVIILGSIKLVNAQTIMQGNTTTQINVQVGNTPYVVLAFDPTRLDWTIHPENGNIRCTAGNAFGLVPINPTSSTGMEFLSGGYPTSWPYTPASAEVICISESGSTINVSGWYDNR